MLKLLYLNIEGDNHLDAVASLVRQEDPDLICFNEVFEVDVPLLKHSFGLDCLFVPAMTILSPSRFRLSNKGNIGTLVLSKSRILSSQIEYYEGNPKLVPELTDTNGNAANRFVLWAEVEKEGENFLVATTHFTITEAGRASDLQRRNMRKILKILEGHKEFVLCGDFNAPRGGEIFGLLSSRYKDCIPSSVTTTLDRNLHRSGFKEEFPDFVVDGLFTSPGVYAHNVRVEFGVSDHCAVLADISLVY